MRDAITRGEGRDADQEAAMESRAGQYDVNQQIGAQKGSLAALMAPRIVQTGSSGTSSGMSDTQAGKNAFGNILDLVLGGASIF
jgi:hypothetical protein